MTSRFVLVTALSACTAACSGNQPHYQCTSSKDCSAAQACVAGTCTPVCTTQADCPAGMGCAAQGVCVKNDGRPLIKSVAGNNPADATKITNGLVVKGDALSDAQFTLEGDGGAFSLAPTQQTATEADLLLPANILSGTYTLAATNAVGGSSDQVELTLPELDASTVLSLVDSGESAVAWQDLAFASAYTNFGNTYQRAQYRRIGHRVELRGTIGCAGGTLCLAFTGDTAVATDPCPPANRRDFGTGSGRTDIDATGNILGVAGDTYVSLDGISYTVDDPSNCP